MKDTDEIKVPESNCERAGKETCSGADQKGNCTEAFPLMDAGESGVGHWEAPDGIPVFVPKG